MKSKPPPADFGPRFGSKKRRWRTWKTFLNLKLAVQTGEKFFEHKKSFRGTSSTRFASKISLREPRQVFWKQNRRPGPGKFFLNLKKAVPERRRPFCKPLRAPKSTSNSFEHQKADLDSTDAFLEAKKETVVPGKLF